MKFIILRGHIIIVAVMLCFSALVGAQDNDVKKVVSVQKTTSNTKSAAIDSADNKTNKPVPIVDKPTKKMVQEATINLQTTVTGNQEQPRVLYILPWQSPAAEDVDFESLENQQKAVFSHVEREELRRELESAGE